MIDQQTQQRIQKELDFIESEENVRILYACESGSRAWGFESKDSDFDVRFIYIRKPHWYLTIQKKRDVIERPIDNDLDISGWDLPKALELFRKSNPPILEWLQSPIIYRKVGSLSSRLRLLMDHYYSPISCKYHYLNMALNNHRQYLQGATVNIKKYFYALRPVLACLWIEQGLGVVPTEFTKLVNRHLIEGNLRFAVDNLLAKKANGHEMDHQPRIPEISDFIGTQLSRLSADNEHASMTKDPGPLDELFAEILIETFGNSIK